MKFLLRHNLWPKAKTFKIFSFRPNGLNALGQLEIEYSRSLSVFSTDFEASVTAYVSSQRAFDRLWAYIQCLQRYTPAGSQIQDILKDYSQRIKSLHQENMFWFYLYFDLIWPSDFTGSLSRKYQKIFKNTSIAKQAKTNWQHLADDGSGIHGNSGRREYLKAVKQQRDQNTINSYPWRKAHQELLRGLYDAMVATHNANKQKLNNCFKSIVYTATSGRQSDSLLSAVSLSDWINGYKRPNTHEQKVTEWVKTSLEPQLKRIQDRRLFDLVIKNTIIAVIVLGLCLAFYTRSIPQKFIVPLLSKIQTFFKMHPLFLKERKKYNFFYNHILDIPRNYRPEDIAANINCFLAKDFPADHERHYYFTDKILRGYFPLLSDGKTDAQLRSQVVAAAALFNEDVAATIAEINSLFSAKIMRESELRKLMLELRRLLVEHDVFPFMFIALRGNAPYLFLFPERVSGKFWFEEEDLEHLGLDVSLYTARAQFPLTAYVVEGTQYPFHERAGYFEGEFAVVFANMAMKTEWTAWHELGHVMDQLRRKIDNIQYPRNIEINSMLFPAIFVEDTKEYVINRLLPILAMADSGDTYVQSAKAIFNGIALYVSRHGGPVVPEVTDNFEKNTIQSMEELLYVLSEEQIHKITLRLYQAPEKYIRDLQPGQYKGIVSNAEELIEGTPYAPQQGFILEGYDEEGSFSPFGPRFLLDGSIAGENPTASSNAFSFLRRIIQIMFNRSSYASTGYKSERLAAAIATFFVVEALFILIGVLSTPVRRRKFHGRFLKTIIDSVYHRNAWSDGKSYGMEKGERELLSTAFSTAGISENLKMEIEAFKKSADEKKRFLFDVLLTLAPFQPKISEVKSRWHNFLFWIPFVGPLLARSSLIFPKQKAFEKRESFNCAIEDLVKYMTPNASLESVQKSYQVILEKYKGQSSAAKPSPDHFMKRIADVQELCLQYLNDMTRDRRPRRPFKKQKTSSGQNERSDFERLDKYSPGDEIKLIDWKSTARSANNEPKVRYLGSSYGTRVCFLIDFRDLNDKAARDKIAYDLANSLKTLELGIDLHLLLLIMPGGDIIKHSLSDRNYLTIPEWFRGVWSIIEKDFRDYTFRLEKDRLDGLHFYTEEENRIYRQTVALTDRNQETQESKISRQYPLYSQNIFMIGVHWDKRTEIEQVVTVYNQYYYWPQFVPASNN